MSEAVRKYAEAADCYSDYKAGGLSYAEYQECLKQFADDDGGSGGGYRRYPSTPSVAKETMSPAEMAEHSRNVNRVLIAITADPSPDARAAKFLSDIKHKSEISEKQRSYRDSLIRKYQWFTRQIPPGMGESLEFRPGSPFPTSFGDADNPKHVAFIEKYWQFWSQRGNRIYPGMARKTPAPDVAPAPVVQDPPARSVGHEDAATKLKILDEFLAKRPDRFIQAMRDWVAAGKKLTENQLKAIRANLYKGGMRPEADSFRMASLTYKRTPMATLRSELIRLAHANPSLRSDILPLVAKKAAVGLTPEDEAQALKALQALGASTGLPFKFSDAMKSEYPISIPRGFSSLFETLSITVRWDRNWKSARVDWSYKHPRGSNGYSIGFIIKEEDGRWGWRSDVGKYGYV